MYEIFQLKWNRIQEIFLKIQKEYGRKTPITHSIWIIPNMVLIKHYLFQINDVFIIPGISWLITYFLQEIHL